MSLDRALPPPTAITLVTAPGCHFCEDAHKTLTELTHRDPSLALQLVEAATPLGTALITEHRPAMNPLVLVDGRYFSAGRLPRRKLEALLARRESVAAGGVRNG